MEHIGVRPVDLSKATGLSASQISRILNGTYGVTLENLLRIASALRCKPDLLLPDNEGSLVELPSDPATKADVYRIMDAITALTNRLGQGA